MATDPFSETPQSQSTDTPTLPLLSWLDELGELIALQRFLAEAACVLADDALEGDNNYSHGAKVAFATLTYRMEQLKIAIGEENKRQHNSSHGAI